MYGTLGSLTLGARAQGGVITVLGLCVCLCICCHERLFFMCLHIESKVLSDSA